MVIFLYIVAGMLEFFVFHSLFLYKKYKILKVFFVFLCPLSFIQKIFDNIFF